MMHGQPNVKKKIENSVWSGRDGKYCQVQFIVNSTECYEEILQHLDESGIGTKFNSVVSVIPSTIFGNKREPSLAESRLKSVKQSAWEKFLLSAKARLRVGLVVKTVQANANLNFDFICLLTVAAIIAAFGLSENSMICMVASMLISPLMGPIMAGTFGTVIADRHLQKIGVLNELFGVLVCLVIGFMFGLAAGLVNEHWGNGGWPTDEMIARGQLRSLWVGLVIAVVSGAVVANCF